MGVKMKWIWKGKISSEEQLPIIDLPPDAVQFNEPETMASISLISLLLAVIAAVVVSAVYIIKIFLTQEFENPFSLIGLLLFLLTFLPLKFLQAGICAKNINVEYYLLTKPYKLVFIPLNPIPKWRTIGISLFPGLVFGLIPLLLWLIIPPGYTASSILFTFGLLILMTEATDYVNAYKAFRQMPKGSVTQISGIHAYWFMPETDKTQFGSRT